MTAKPILASALALLSLASSPLLLAQTTPPVADAQAKYTYTADKPSILVTNDHPEFILSLKSNPTTGYTWFLRDYDANLLVPVKHSFEKTTNPNLMGAPGYEIWVFKLKNNAFTVPQQTLLRMVYSRPWQSSDSSTQLVFRISTMSKK